MFFLPPEAFSATAARTSLFNAAALILSPSWKSMARVAFASKPPLKRLLGSSKLCL